jgi:hypothetical protein
MPFRAFALLPGIPPQYENEKIGSYSGTKQEIFSACKV